MIYDFHTLVVLADHGEDESERERLRGIVFDRLPARHRSLVAAVVRRLR